MKDLESLKAQTFGNSRVKQDYDLLEAEFEIDNSMFGMRHYAE